MKQTFLLFIYAAILLTACKGTQITTQATDTPVLPTTTASNATKTSQAPIAGIVQDNSFIDEYGFLHIFGVFENTGDVPLEYVKIIINFREADGKLVGSKLTFTLINVVLPGEMAPYDLTISPSAKLSEWQSYEIITESLVTDFLFGYTDLVIVSSSEPQVGDIGIYEIVGEIRNIGSLPSNHIKIAGALYGTEGEILSADSTYLDLFILQPNESASFTLYFYDTAPEKPVTYQLWAQGAYTDIPTLTQTQVALAPAKTPTRIPLPTHTPLPPTTVNPATQTQLAALTLTPTETPLPSYDLTFEVEQYGYAGEAVLKIIRKSTNELVTSINLYSFYKSEEEKAAFSGYVTPKWSPNGRYLAFSGAIYGPSLDLYVYDAETNAIRRLTDGPFEAVSLHWSPDGKWIVHAAQKGVGCDNDALWAARVDGSEVRLLYALRDNMELIGWIGPSTFYAAEVCFERRIIRLVDIEKRTATLIVNFEISGVLDLAVDPESGVMVFNVGLSSTEQNLPGFEGSGFYLVSPQQITPMYIVPGNGYEKVEWDEGLGFFVTEVQCEDNKEQYIAVSPQGETSCVSYDPKKFTYFIDSP